MKKSRKCNFQKTVKILSMAPDVHKRELESFIPPPITRQHKNRISPFWISRVPIQGLSKYIVKRKAKLVSKLFFKKKSEVIYKQWARNLWFQSTILRSIVHTVTSTRKTFHEVAIESRNPAHHNHIEHSLTVQQKS